MKRRELSWNTVLVVGLAISDVLLALVLVTVIYLNQSDPAPVECSVCTPLEMSATELRDQVVEKFLIAHPSKQISIELHALWKNRDVKFRYEYDPLRQHPVAYFSVENGAPVIIFDAFEIEHAGVKEWDSNLHWRILHAYTAYFAWSVHRTAANVPVDCRFIWSYEYPAYRADCKWFSEFWPLGGLGGEWCEKPGEYLKTAQQIAKVLEVEHPQCAEEFARYSKIHR